MSEVTHRTLAGDEIIVFDDKSFGELAGFDADSHSFKLSMQMPRSRLAVLKALYRHGVIVDRSGFAMGHLAERVREFDALSFNVNAVLTAPTMQHCVERVTKGRRTMRIALVALPATWLRHVEGALHSEGPPEPTVEMTDAVEAVGDAVHPPAPQLEKPMIDVYQPEPAESRTPIELEVAGAVATALMAQVVEIIAHNGSNVLAVKNRQLHEENISLGKRLGEQVSYVDRLRREVREAQDQLAATISERDGLRQRLASAEHNLKVATSADAQRLIDAEVHRQVDKLMRQRPGSERSEQERHGAA